MSNILIINAHHPYPFAEGKLNASLVQRASEQLKANGHQIRIVEVDKGWDVEQELAHHQWADVILLQTPVNWMGVPWVFKKYMDEVYTAGMGGALCHGDGRTEAAPKANYGAGGTLNGKRYMLSLTFNAPTGAFDNPDAPFFEGRSVDDLLWPTHLNLRFFGMTALPTFSAHDVMKNPNIEADLERFAAHIDANFSTQR